MTSITDFSAFCATLVTAIEGLEGFVLVAEDNHAVNKLKDKRNIQLVAVIPSVDREGAPGRATDNQVVLLFILEKKIADPTEPKELDQYQRTQNVALAIRSYLEAQQEDGCSIFFRLKIDSIHLDPEYNIFGGWNGWSLQLIF